MVNTGDGRQGNIKADNFGGLNKTSSPLNIPLNDSPYLLNVDIDVSGKVKKRKGTRTHWKELTNKRMPLTEINSNLGYSFIVSKLEKELRVFEVDNDISRLIWVREAFRDQTDFVQFVSLPGDNVRVLILSNSQVPVQLQLHEQRIITTSTSKSFALGSPFTTLTVSRVYLNQKAVTTTYDGATLTITSPETVALNDTLDIITFSWQWWAESVYWFGDNFHRSLPRNGATLSDQNVAIPTTLFSDIDRETAPSQYGILAYATNAYGSRYTFSASGKPQTAFDYSFGDGSTYQFSTTQSVTPSPFFLTFGLQSGTVKFEFTDRAILGTGFFVPDHGLNSFDIITFSADELLVPPFVIDTPYYVRKVNENFFELYSDVTLTTRISPGTRPSFSITDANIDVQLNRINVAHGFAVGSITPVVFENLDYLLPGGTVAGQRYYVFALTAGILEVYFDKNATRRLDLIARSERTFSNTNVVITPSNTITISNHLLFAKDGIRFYPYTGSTLPAPLVAGTLYYVDIVNPSAIQIFTDKNLTSLVSLTTTGSGNSFIRLDGGTMIVRVDGGRQVLEKVPFSKVDIVRLRQIPFNDGAGVLASNLYVTVNSQPVVTNLTGAGLAAPYAVELYTDTSDVPLTAPVTALVKRLGFTGSIEIGVPRDSLIRYTNTERKWTPAPALGTPFNNDNGSWVPAYGISKYADYNAGTFPSVGAVFQARLVLSNFPGNSQLVLFSSRSATTTPDEYYQYFQISDDNKIPEVDPFDILLPELSSYSVQCLVEWQRSLYVFTDNSVYRTYSADSIVTLANRIVGKVSEKGAVNPRCVALTESSLIFLSDNGVYDLTPVLEQEYRAAEISIKIRPYFGLSSVRRYKNLAWLAFDDVNLKLYVGAPKQSDVTEVSVLLVFDTIQKAWTEYSAIYYFRSYIGIAYTDVTLGRLFMISHKLPCFNAFTRFGYRKYADFIDVNIEGGGLNVITTTPAFWSGLTFPNVTKYLPDLTMNFLVNVNDVRVFVGSTFTTLTELVYGTTFTKSNDGYVELVSNPGDGVIVVVPRITGSFYGTSLFIDNLLTTLTNNSFGGIDFSNPCRCAFGSVSSGGPGIVFRRCEFVLQPGQKAEVGYPYLTIYVSPPFTADLLSTFKRIRHLYVMFENIRSRYTVEDVNLVTQQYSALVNRAENDVGVSLAMLYQTDNTGEISEDVYENPYVEKHDIWTVFKEPLQGIGNTHQFVAFSLDVDVWVMDGYQITGKLVGERHISGDR